MPFLRNLGLPEIMIIVLIIIVFFGSKKMNDLARNAGKASKELKNVKKEYEDAVSGKDSEKDIKKEKETKQKEVKPKEVKK